MQSNQGGLVFQRGVGVLIVSLVASVLLVGSAHASDEPVGSAVARSKAVKKPKVVLKASSKEVTEGDVVRLIGKVGARKKAKRITLQRYRPSVYFSGGAWEDVKRSKVKKKRVRFKTTVTDQNVAKYRVVVTYKGRKKPVVSKPAKIKVWRWIPLSEYHAYYSTGGSGFGTAALNGRSYEAWGAYSFSRAVAWEDRFTPGRNCTAFAGTAGITDLSDDTSTATISLFADEVEAWHSPVLTPGMTIPFEIPLAKPYRFSIRAANTSPVGLKAWPAIGDPSFLCTGV